MRSESSASSQDGTTETRFPSPQPETPKNLSKMYETLVSSWALSGEADEPCDSSALCLATEQGGEIPWSPTEESRGAGLSQHSKGCVREAATPES